MDNDKAPKDAETLLMALDQISQTIDVMTSVVGRLRNYVQKESASTGDSNGLKKEMGPDRVLH
ncbi:MAG: hypothetical protein ACK5HY_04220 [Parahaliea sp.]